MHALNSDSEILDIIIVQPVSHSTKHASELKIKHKSQSEDLFGQFLKAMSLPDRKQGLGPENHDHQHEQRYHVCKPKTFIERRL